MRDLLTLIEGAQWAKHHVIKAGTMLFHGTDDDDFHPSEISGPAWFSTDNDVAEKFATGRLLAYRLKADLKLPLITSADEMDEFAEKFHIDRMSSEDVRDSAKKAGIPGWIIPDNYEPGDDILICDLSVLEPVTSDLGDLQESERIDEMVNHDELELYHWTDAESLRQIMRSGHLQGHTEHTINGQKVAGVSMARNPFFDISSTYAISGIKAWRIGFNYQRLRYDHKIQPVRDDYLQSVPRQTSIQAHALINKKVSSDETEEFVTGDVYPIWNYVTSIAIEDRHIDVDYHPRETAEWEYEEFDNGVGGMSQEDQELLFDILAGTYFGADGMHRAFKDDRPLAIKVPVPVKIIDRDTHRILDAKAVFQERFARSIYNDQHVPDEPEGKTPWPVSSMSPSRDQRNQMFSNKTRTATMESAEPHHVFGNWPQTLRDNRAIGEYVEGLDPRVDAEMVEEHFFGAHAVLKLIPIDSVREGNPDGNVRSASKEKKFAKMDLAKQPPIGAALLGDLDQETLDLLDGRIGGHRLGIAFFLSLFRRLGLALDDQFLGGVQQVGQRNSFLEILFGGGEGGVVTGLGLGLLNLFDEASHGVGGRVCKANGVVDGLGQFLPATTVGEFLADVLVPCLVQHVVHERLGFDELRIGDATVGRGFQIGNGGFDPCATTVVNCGEDQGEVGHFSAPCVDLRRNI